MRHAVRADGEPDDQVGLDVRVARLVAPLPPLAEAAIEVVLGVAHPVDHEEHLRGRALGRGVRERRGQHADLGDQLLDLLVLDAELLAELRHVDRGGPLLELDEQLATLLVERGDLRLELVDRIDQRTGRARDRLRGLGPLAHRDRGGGRAHHDQAAEAERDEPRVDPRYRRHQLGHQLGHRREPLGAIALEAARDHPADRRRDLGALGRRERAVALLEHRHAGRAGQRVLAVERLVERDAEAELIGARVDVGAGELLGRHVARRAEHGARGGQRGVERGRHRGRGAPRGLVVEREQRPREPEIGDADAAVAADQHVVGLEVAVEQAHAVGGDQAARRLQEHVHDLAPGPRVALEPAGQGVALDELHRDVQIAVVGGADVVDADHVGVGQLGDRLGLAAQPLLGVLGGELEPRAQQLERDLAIELGIVRGEHHAHAAGPERGQHEVAPHPVAHGQDALGQVGDLGRRQLLVGDRGDVGVERRVLRQGGDQIPAVPAARQVALRLEQGGAGQGARDELTGGVVVEALHGVCQA